MLLQLAGGAPGASDGAELLAARRTATDDVVSIKIFAGETELLTRLIWRTDRWREQTDAAIAGLSQQRIPPDLPHRLVQVLRSIHMILECPGSKVLVFTAWRPTLDILYTWLTRARGRQAVARFVTGLDEDALQAEVDRYQADGACRIMLTDESGGEGRNFQIADQVVHVDLPWTPGKLEQRIGRVDRLGRKGVVVSVVPLARNTLEEDLYRIWHEAFDLFRHSMSGLEIVLEDVQDQIAVAFASSTTEGVAGLLPSMKSSARRLRAEVEEERYFEEGSIDYRRRGEFEQISERYRDGELLRDALLGWAEMAGLRHHYNPEAKMAVFDPKEFSVAAINNARFARPPNMQEALRRSRRLHNLVLKGTFDRDLAVRREDIIFFAPGEVWTDAILTNALRADRGRCSAILRPAPELTERWYGFEFLFRISIDPRPLYEQGYHPVHLLRAQGYLGIATYRACVSIRGEPVKPNSPVGRVLHRPLDVKDKHLGKRAGNPSPLMQVKQLLSPNGWEKAVTRSLYVAMTELQRELAFTTELSQEADNAFRQSAAGQRAAHRWVNGDGALLTDEIKQYEAISQALVHGLACPRWEVESACFWILVPGGTGG